MLCGHSPFFIFPIKMQRRKNTPYYLPRFFFLLLFFYYRNFHIVVKLIELCVILYLKYIHWSQYYPNFIFRCPTSKLNCLSSLQLPNSLKVLEMLSWDFCAYQQDNVMYLLQICGQLFHGLILLIHHISKLLCLIADCRGHLGTGNSVLCTRNQSEII